MGNRPDVTVESSTVNMLMKDPGRYPISQIVVSRAETKFKEPGTLEIYLELEMQMFSLTFCIG